MRIAVVSTGCVGLVVGACFAETGNESSASTATQARCANSIAAAFQSMS